MEFLWLENLNSPESLAWVQKENAFTVEQFKKYSGFQQHYEEGLNVYSSTHRLRFRYMRQDIVYDAQRTAENPIGRWVRSSYEDVMAGQENWEVLFDFDQFSKEQGQQWAYKMADFSPNYKRVLLSMSFEDGDRCWTKEFDLETKKFVDSGFDIPLSKAFYCWFDNDSILVGGDTPETTTKFGFSKSLSLVRRGSSERQLISEVGEDYMSMHAYDEDKEGEGRFLGHQKNWDDSETYWLSPELQLTKLAMPKKVSYICKIDDDVIVKLADAFQTFQAGTVLKAPLKELMTNASPKFEPLWQPSKTRFSCEYFSSTENGFFCFYRENVATKVSYFKKVNGTFQEIEQKIPSGLEVTALHKEKSCTKFLIQAESFANPPALYEWDGYDSYTKVLELPAQFSGNYEVNQRWATSRDGTKIPYFIVHKPGIEFNGKNPTMLNGYGGFMIAKTPNYSASLGKGWLEKGGVYVLANIRGGDEFGVEWSLCARKENRQLCYDDFIAVAEHLIETKVTSPRHLAIRGGSNGGLLMGAVTMQRPDLFSAVVCSMPLLDMLRYTLLPPGGIWAAEFGDPADPKMRAVIEKYSPFQNIKTDKKYPPVFFWTSKADDRVHPSHARRMAAKMKAMGHHCFLYEEPTGGHNGGDVTVKAFGDALMFSYLWSHLS